MTPHVDKYPLLSQIDSPKDLKKLSVDQLPQVCAELRSMLISELSSHPGHFASSMGAVELTVALHYVYDTPDDRIVWDVGHQAYSHKILTGRRDRFDTIRTMGGLAPFPTPAESPYDTFTAGHASNSISGALGMAMANSLTGSNRNVVAVIGDASIGGGLAFEGLNNAAQSNANVLIVLNDNDMSIDRPTGSLSRYLGHLTTSKSYNTARYRVYRALKRMHLMNDHLRGAILRFNNSLKALLSHQQNIFEGLNIRYFGPIDGHDVVRLVRVLTDIKDMKGPRMLHLRTVKGKGYEPSEQDPCTWHAPGKFDPATGRRLSSPSGGCLKYQDVFGHTLVELAANDSKIVGITAAMPSGTSMSLMKAAYPERTFDVGIAEGHAVTFAAGLAKEGLKPFCAIYSSFLQRGYDQIIHDVALQQLPVTLCIDRAGLVGEDGATHHGSYDMAYLRPIPSLLIASPRDEHQLRNLLYTAATQPHGPMAIRYPRGRGHNPDWHNDMKPLAIGRGERLRKGKDVAVLSIGPLADEVTKAIAEAEKIGLSVAQYDMVWLRPLDEEILREVTDFNCPIITVEDGTVNGGLGTTVSQWLAEHGTHRPIKIIGIPDTFVTHGTPAQLYKQCGMDAEGILEAITSFAAKP